MFWNRIMAKNDKQAEAGRPLRDVDQLLRDTSALVEKIDGVVGKVDETADKADSIISNLIAGKLRIRTSLKFRPLGIDIWLEKKH